MFARALLFIAMTMLPAIAAAQTVGAPLVLERRSRSARQAAVSTTLASI
jgi:hypothetical protein